MFLFAEGIASSSPVDNDGKRQDSKEDVSEALHLERVIGSLTLEHSEPSAVPKLDTNDLLALHFCLQTGEKNASKLTEAGTRRLQGDGNMDEFFQECRRYREIFSTITTEIRNELDSTTTHTTVREHEKFKELTQVFLDVCELCHKKRPSNSPLHLPPLYANNDRLSEVVKNVSSAMYFRYQHPDWAFETGHLALTGVKGVGKSTLMVAFSLAITILCPNYLLIYVDFLRWSKSENKWTV